jgi:hypothetical protein
MQLLTVQAQPLQFVAVHVGTPTIDARARPEGRLSVTVTVPVVEAVPAFETVTV